MRGRSLHRRLGNVAPGRSVPLPCRRDACRGYKGGGRAPLHHACVTHASRPIRSDKSRLWARRPAILFDAYFAVPEKPVHGIGESSFGDAHGAGVSTEHGGSIVVSRWGCRHFPPLVPISSEQRQEHFFNSLIGGEFLERVSTCSEDVGNEDSVLPSNANDIASWSPIRLHHFQLPKVGIDDPALFIFDATQIGPESHPVRPLDSTARTRALAQTRNARMARHNDCATVLVADCIEHQCYALPSLCVIVLIDPEDVHAVAENDHIGHEGCDFPAKDLE